MLLRAAAILTLKIPMIDLSMLDAAAIATLEISEAGLGTLNLALDKSEDPAAADALRQSVASGCNFVDVRSPKVRTRKPTFPDHNYPRPDFEI